MRRSCICCLLLLLAPALSVLASEDTWIANRRKAQLAMDPTLIPKGKGMLFVPTMTSGFREPNYQIFSNGKEIATEETGTGVLLSPGAYEVLIGSGAIAQMMRREVEIVEGWTSLVKPWWSGLAIDVIDETRASIKESYELFEEGRGQENFGIGFGVEEERGEAVDTWLLKPGTYTIVKPHGCAIFQAKNNKSHWSVMINLSDQGDIKINHRRHQEDKVIAQNMTGKSFDLKVRDNGHEYEVYLNGEKVGAGHYDRPEGHTSFRWGMYLGNNPVRHDAMIFVTGAKFK